MYIHLLTLAASAAAAPTVYLIRHAEKPADGGVGLSFQGQERAECLRNVFGASSEYNIGYIMAQTPKKNGKRIRAYETVRPLSQDLGIEIDLSCDRDDPECVQETVETYDGPGNVLICWEHDALTDIVEELGAAGAEYPDERYGSYQVMKLTSDDRFDLIWTDPWPYDEIAFTSEECPGLDEINER